MKGKGQLGNRRGVCNGQCLSLTSAKVTISQGCAVQALKCLRARALWVLAFSKGTASQQLPSLSSKVVRELLSANGMHIAEDTKGNEVYILERLKISERKHQLEQEAVEKTMS